jgi:hypothetical protein
MYLDRLDGRITQEFFDKHSASWRREQDGLQRKIQDIQKATPAPIDKGHRYMLRLTSRASELFLQQRGPAYRVRPTLCGLIVERTSRFRSHVAVLSHRHANRRGKREIVSKVWLPKAIPNLRPFG